MGKFSLDIGKFCDKTKLKPNTVKRKLAFDIIAGVIIGSPVDTGRFRANWRVGIGAPDLTVNLGSGTLEQKLETKNVSTSFGGRVEADIESNGKKFDRDANSLIPDMQAQAMKSTLADPIYITNNLVYAEPLENGHSKQAPHGVMKITVAKVVANFNAVVQEIKDA